MAQWKCEHSIWTRARRDLAWTYWTDLSNHVKLEQPIVQRIELDGPFASGTTGRTVTAEFSQEWELAGVREREQFGIVGYTPDGSGSLTFSWRFEDEADGTRITYWIVASGPDVDEQLAIFQGMGDRMPEALAVLGAQLDELAEARS